MKKQNKAFALVILLIFYSLPFLSAQVSGEKSLLWEISGNGLSTPSYLYGTIHVMPAKQFETWKVADNLLKDSEQLILEMVIDVPLATQIEWAKQMLLPDGGNLQNLIPEENFNELKAYVLDSLGIKESKFNLYLKFKPFAFYSALIPDVIGKKLESYEMHYTKIARAKELPVIGLETFEYQMGIFDAIPTDTQVEMLFGEQTDMKKEFDDMIVMYQEQDIYKMAIQLEDENEDYPQLADKLVADRNRNWMEKLSGLMVEHSCFIAVGAGHLAGSDGLIGLLREGGYTVTAVPLERE